MTAAKFTPGQCTLSAFLSAEATLHIVSCNDPGSLRTHLVMAAALPSLSWHSKTQQFCQRALDCIFSSKPSCPGNQAA